VPCGFVPPPLPLPPHEESKRISAGTATAILQRRRIPEHFLSKAASARMLEAQIQNGGTSLKTSGMPRERVVVGTETVKLDGALALTVTVAGTEQVAPVGAPVQVNDAVPDTPPPPIARMYEAVAPAVTVVEAELPEATLKPRLPLPPVPDNITICGLPEASSAILKVPVRDPCAVGVDVTCAMQVLPGATAVPQVFVCAKSPVVVSAVIVNGAVPAFVIVTCCPELVVFRACAGNTSDAGARASAKRRESRW
jgi:hypothetical protein